jgi:hypothetical protein
MKSPTVLAGLVVLAVLACCALVAPLGIQPDVGLGLVGLGLGMSFLMADRQARGTRALPAAAASTVYGAAIDLGLGERGDFLANAEFKLSAPAVTTVMAPDTRTFTYSIVHSENSDLSEPTVLVASCIVQTGAGGAGAAADSYTFRAPVDVKRYVGVKIVSGASTANASTVSATLEVLT